MKTTKVPVNTERQAADQPGMLGWVMGGNPNAILAQEAEGQSSFVNSETLPTDMGRSRDYDTKAVLEAAGFKFVCVVPDDPMFQVVEMPKGWQKKATDHSMWSNLVDDKGRVRASIFYKAAFYDRSAHMNLVSRFGVSRDYDREKKEGVAVAVVKDGANVIFTTEPVKLPAREDKNYYEIGDDAQKKAVEWLDQQYPDWKNPGAYWD